MKYIRMLAFVSAILPLNGCGLHQWEPMDLTLSPRLSLSPSNVGSGSKVYVNVTDHIVEKKIGYRLYDYLGSKWAGEIKLTHSVEPQFAESLRRGLKSIGFEVLTVSEDSPSVLEVTVNNLIFRGFDVRNTQDLVATYRIAVSGNATIRKDNVKLFDKPYNLLHEWKRHIAPSPAEIQDETNKVASDFLMAILEDSELLTKLK